MIVYLEVGNVALSHSSQNSHIEMKAAALISLYFEIIMAFARWIHHTPFEEVSLKKDLVMLLEMFAHGSGIRNCSK